MQNKNPNQNAKKKSKSKGGEAEEAVCNLEIIRLPQNIQVYWIDDESLIYQL